MPRAITSNWADLGDEELLQLRLSELPLKLEGTLVETRIDQLKRELTARGLDFPLHFYLSDEWFTPDGQASMAVPFYLAHPRLERLEKAQMLAVEGGEHEWCMRILRHEAGHVIDNAYKLRLRRQRRRLFGSPAKPYPEFYAPRPYSKRYVLHLDPWYAQSHPDEDFAETFAVWLTPRSGWRRRYRNWPVIRKLRLVSRLMTRVRDRRPVRNSGARLNPVRALTLTLAEHYGQRAEQYRASAHGYVDDKLRAVFPDMDEARELDADALVRRNRREILSRVVRWSGMDQEDVERILTKIEDRSRDLGLGLQRNQVRARLLDLTALTTALAMDLGYTGRFCD